MSNQITNNQILKMINGTKTTENGITRTCLVLGSIYAQIKATVDSKLEVVVLYYGKEYRRTIKNSQVEIDDYLVNLVRFFIQA
jgi:hypothetical protein